MSGPAPGTQYLCVPSNAGGNLLCFREVVYIGELVLESVSNATLWALPLVATDSYARPLTERKHLLVASMQCALSVNLWSLHRLRRVLHDRKAPPFSWTLRTVACN